jgi:hypothetical protein
MTRAVIETAMILLLKTLVNSEVKLMILPLCIFPLISETTIHINASPMKNGVCDGKYDLRLAGLVHTMARKDIVNITISTNKVTVLNLRFSIDFYQQTLPQVN